MKRSLEKFAGFLFLVALFYQKIKIKAEAKVVVVNKLYGEKCKTINYF